MARTPFSISSLAWAIDFFARLACDQVCEPMVWPAATTCLRISGCQLACLPIGKKVAFTHCAASAASTAGVLPGHGPSSNVSTTSPGSRKSCALNCSLPKPGPLVVSISTVRATPSAPGFLQLDLAATASAAVRFPFGNAADAAVGGAMAGC